MWASFIIGFLLIGRRSYEPLICFSPNMSLSKALLQVYNSRNWNRNSSIHVAKSLIQVYEPILSFAVRWFKYLDSPNDTMANRTSL